MNEQFENKQPKDLISQLNKVKPLGKENVSVLLIIERENLR
jgi:hypothetical protein